MSAIRPQSENIVQSIGFELPCCEDLSSLFLNLLYLWNQPNSVPSQISSHKQSLCRLLANDLRWGQSSLPCLADKNTQYRRAAHTYVSLDLHTETLLTFLYYAAAMRRMNHTLFDSIITLEVCSHFLFLSLLGILFPQLLLTYKIFK